MLRSLYSLIDRKDDDVNQRVDKKYKNMRYLHAYDQIFLKIQFLFIYLQFFAEVRLYFTAGRLHFTAGRLHFTAGRMQKNGPL